MLLAISVRTQEQDGRVEEIGGWATDGKMVVSNRALGRWSKVVVEVDLVRSGQSLVLGAEGDC